MLQVLTLGAQVANRMLKFILKQAEAHNKRLDAREKEIAAARAKEAACMPTPLQVTYAMLRSEQSQCERMCYVFQQCYFCDVRCSRPDLHRTQR